MTGKKIRYFIAPGYEVLEEWLEHLPEFYQSGGVSIFKDRNEVKVFKEKGFELNVKSFKIPHFVNRFAYVHIRGSKAARSFRNARILLEAGASTPDPVAYVECISSGILGESYYVSLQYPHDFTLRDVLDYRIPDRQNILIQWVYYTWLYLHQHGIFHLDYSPGNTLIKKEEDQYHFAVVDLNRMKFIPVDFRKGIKNFRQLHTDAETLGLIASEYATLCNASKEIATETLLKLDRNNKKFRDRKDRLHELFGKTEE